MRGQEIHAQQQNQVFQLKSLPRLKTEINNKSSTIEIPQQSKKQTLINDQFYQPNSIQVQSIKVAQQPFKQYKNMRSYTKIIKYEEKCSNLYLPLIINKHNQIEQKLKKNKSFRRNTKNMNDLSMQQKIDNDQLKNLALRLQKINGFLKNLTYFTIFQILSHCKTVKFKKYDFILNKKIFKGIYTYLIITGTIILQHSSNKIEVICTNGDTFQEENLLKQQQKLNQQYAKYDYIRCMQDQSICIKISKKQWQQIKTKLMTEYKLQKDIKYFENQLKKNYAKKIKKLVQLQYQLLK